MKNRLVIIILLCLVCGNAVTAQPLSEKQRWKVEKSVNLKIFAGETLCDKDYIQNIDYMEFLYWLEQTYGKESEQYKFAIPDLSVARKLLPDSIARAYDIQHLHPMYRNGPVLGVSHEQAAAYCRWRSDRVAEQMLEDLKLRTYVPPTAENHFTIETYDNPQSLRFLRFFVPADMDTRYGFYCFAVWR